MPRTCSGNFPRLAFSSSLFQKPSEGISLPVHGGQARSMQAPAAGCGVEPANEHPSLTDREGMCSFQASGQEPSLVDLSESQCHRLQVHLNGKRHQRPQPRPHISLKRARSAGRKLVTWHRTFTVELFLSSCLATPCPAHLECGHCLF